MVSIKDIARLSGVSASTVSRFLNESGYVGKDARDKIQKAIKDLNFSPNAIARSLVTNKTNIIGLLIPHINSPFFSGLTVSVEEEARKLGYNVILCHTNEDTEREKEYLQILMERRADGIIITPVGRDFEYFKPLIKNLPMVFTARKSNKLNVSSVVADNIDGSARVIEHLFELGHKRIAIINGPLYTSTGYDRWLGVQQAFIKRGMEIDMNLVKEGNFRIDGGYKSMSEIMAQGNPPTAVFGANHLTGFGAMKFLLKNHISIPEQIAVAAFDGFEDAEISEIINPPITANIHPTHEMGATAMKLLHEQIQNKNNPENIVLKEIVVKTRFEARTSTTGIIE